MAWLYRKGTIYVQNDHPQQFAGTGQGKMPLESHGL